MHPPKQPPSSSMVRRLPAPFTLRRALPVAAADHRTQDADTDWAGEPAVNPMVEDAYWRENFRRRSYYVPGRTYIDYQCAFRYGWESALRKEYLGKSFEQVERMLERGWPGKLITWKESREAARDAWNRVRGH